MTGHHNEGERSRTLKQMEGLAKGLFRDTEGPQPDIEPERVHWRVRVKRWFSRAKKQEGQ